MEWMHSSYEKNTAYPEQLIHKTITGEKVRSKSEAFIYSCLIAKKIPFRYECALHLDKKTYYPDFTIRHPRTGELIYWEHFGKMDDRGYARKTYAKLEHYQYHGIIPSVNLITTYETSEHPLSFEEVETIVERWFPESEREAAGKLRRFRTPSSRYHRNNVPQQKPSIAMNNCTWYFLTEY